MPHPHETAYPRLKSAVADAELAEMYTPTAEACAWAEAHTQSETAKVGILLLLVKVRMSSDSMVSLRCLTAREGRKRQRDEYGAESDQGQGRLVGVSQAIGECVPGLQSDGV